MPCSADDTPVSPFILLKHHFELGHEPDVRACCRASRWRRRWSASMQLGWCCAALRRAHCHLLGEGARTAAWHLGAAVTTPFLRTADQTGRQRPALYGPVPRCHVLRAATGPSHMHSCTGPSLACEPRGCPVLRRGALCTALSTRVERTHVARASSRFEHPGNGATPGS